MYTFIQFSNTITSNLDTANFFKYLNMLYTKKKHHNNFITPTIPIQGVIMH